MALRLLPDVNVWVALLDEAHTHNPKARALMQRANVKIATCPLIENGVLRVLNLPGYSAFGAPGFDAVRAKLDSICHALDHEFWPDTISLCTAGVADWSRVMGHGQITDVYLLALATAHNGCLVTLDHGVTLSTVPGAAAKNLVLI